MKNKFNKTGLEFGNTLQSAIKSRNINSILNEQINQLRVQWPYPKESKKLVLWLMGLMNSKEEYEELQEDLVELEVLTSDSLKLKGGCKAMQF